MKRNLFALAIMMISALGLTAQLVNNQGTIVIEQGATLIVETDVDNTTGSTITNNGTLVVSGDLTNGGTWTNATNSIVRFDGSGDSELTSGGATIENLEMSKSSGNVLLQDDATVSTSIDWPENGNIVLGDHDLTLELAGTVTNASADGYVDASGAGLMRKQYDLTDLNFQFPVGDVDDYSPVQINANGGSYAAGADVAVNVVDAELTTAQPVDASDKLSRYWHVETSGITATPTYTLTGTYAPTGDVVGTASEIHGFTYNATDGIDFSGQATGAGTVTATKSNSDNFEFSGTNRYGTVGLNAFLQGPLDAAGTTMSTGINGILPLTSPYTAGETVTAIPATDIVDWVEIEIYDAAASGANMVASASAFLKSDGSLVALSGEGDPIIKEAPANGFVALRHRNHLGVLHDMQVDFDGTDDVDFRSTGTSTFGSNAQATVGSNAALRGGDVNGDGFVYYNAGGNDRVALLGLLSNNLNGFLQTYNTGDVNLDSFTYYNAGGNDRVAILNFLQNNLNGFFQQQLP